MDTTALPTGTVTFLFTDIEGSTRLWEQHPEAMHPALARHDVLLAAGIQQHGGVVVKSRGEGDSFFAVFPHAPAALAAALALQRALLAEPWPAETPLRIRIALHTAAAELREGDYYGPGVNRCARLRAVAHGGQVLLSQAARDAVREALPAGISLRDLGSHRLKDLQQPEHVFQLLSLNLPAEFPPLRSLEAFAHNLPAQLTRFIGREQAMAEVKQFLATTRLLTLTGSGGCGKTRLALQVAADLLEQYPDGVWLVELAALTDPALVPQAVATALGIREEPGRPLTATLADYLRPRALLLLLDNCEHLLSAGAQVGEALLRACPKLRILASSREGLGIAGERTYRVPSLCLPDPTHLPPVEQLTDYEAVRLFVERAAFSQPTFTVTPQNAAAVAQVCHRLDGIPLALELAAARVRILSVEQIAARLDDRFRLLTGGSRTALPRQQTLRALIDWSYDLLAEPERLLLRRLSVFAGGWTLEAAEAVGAGGGIESGEVLDLLTALADKSLLVVEEQRGERRYRLLETVRQYARERLLEMEEGAAVREQHLNFFLRLAEENAPPLVGWDLLEMEHDNLRAALEWCRAGPRGAEAGLRLAGSLAEFWCHRGYPSEGRAHLADALARPETAEPAAPRSRALIGASYLAWFHGDLASARQFAEQSLALQPSIGDRRELGLALVQMGMVAYGEGKYDEAQQCCAECLPIWRELGDHPYTALMLRVIGEILYRQGDPESARPLIEESLALEQQAGNEVGTAWSLWGLGCVAQMQGNVVEARSHHTEALRLFRKVKEKQGRTFALVALAGVAAARGELERAARLLGVARALHEAMNSPIPPIAQEDYDRTLALARAGLGAAAFTVAWTEGRAMTLDQAVEYALQEVADG